MSERIYRRESQPLTTEEAIERANRELAKYTQETLPPDDDFNWHACPLCGDMTEGDCRYVKIWRETSVDTRNNRFRIDRRNRNGKRQEGQEAASGPGEARRTGQARPEEEVARPYIPDYSI